MRKLKNIMSDVKKARTRITVAKLQCEILAGVFENTKHPLIAVPPSTILKSKPKSRKKKDK